MSITVKRLRKEWQNIQANPLDGLTFEVIDGDWCHWQAVIIGPDGTPYAGGHFILDIRIPDEYPTEAPDIKFVSPIFHTHVNQDNGEVQLDLLWTGFTSAFTISLLVEHVRALLGRASPDINADSHASRLFGRSPTCYLAEARRQSQHYASAPDIANWDYFPISSRRSSIERVIVRKFNGKRITLDASDKTTIGDIKHSLSASGGPQVDGINIIGRGLYLSDDNTLQYYGIIDNEVLTMSAPDTSVFHDVDILKYVYGPDAPQFVVTIWQQMTDDNRIDVTATSIGGTEIVKLNTTPEVMLSVVRTAVIESIPSTSGRLRFVTCDGMALEDGVK